MKWQVRNAAVAAGNARDPPLPLPSTRAQRRAAQSTATNGPPSPPGEGSTRTATMDASVGGSGGGAAQSTATEGSSRAAAVDASVGDRGEGGNATSEAEVAELREVVIEALRKWGGVDAVVEEHLEWALKRLEA